MKFFNALSTALGYQRFALAVTVPQVPLGHELNDAKYQNNPLSHGLDHYIQETIQEWHAPGLAVAVIRGNDTWAKGYGYASLPSTPVTPHTLFLTGSTTKSFTAAAISLLVDNSSQYSSITWITPMRQLLPGEFILSDEWATNHVTLEDALSHRTGCARHDLSLAKDPQDALRRLQHLPMATEPRVKFHYSNMMYAVAGYLVEKLAGMTLSTFFHKYLWEPMHLNETFLGLYDPALNTSGLLVADEYYYNKLTDDYMRIDHPDVSPDEGAGAVVSNVLDYAKYLRVMMDEGAPLSKAGHRELKTPRSFYQPSGPPFVGPMTYTLGWMSGIFQGEQIWLHSGQVNMFTTWMLMVPSRGFGIAVMTNSASKAMTLVLYRIIYDLFDVEDKDRFDFAAKFKNDEHDQDRYLATCSKRLYPHLPSPPLAPTVPLANHTGIFYDAGYGEVVVFDTCDTAAMDSEESLSADNACQLRLRKDDGHSTEYTLLLEHKSGDHWLARGELWDSGVTVFCAEAEFRVDAAGIVVQVGLNIRLEDEVPFIWFTRVE